MCFASKEFRPKTANLSKTFRGVFQSMLLEHFFSAQGPRKNSEPLNCVEGHASAAGDGHRAKTMQIGWYLILMRKLSKLGAFLG